VVGVALAVVLSLPPGAQAARGAAGSAFSCANWQGARRHVLAGEALETLHDDRADHRKAIAHYRVALSACRDYPWAYGDLQQSYGDLHQFSDADRYGWRGIAVARRTKDRWSWTSSQYRGFLAGCFDNLGWSAQMVADTQSGGAKGYRARLDVALGYFHTALVYDTHDTYARQHALAIERYLARPPATPGAASR
jgi:hypothetical protein